jgi:hypothetical protein
MITLGELETRLSAAVKEIHPRLEIGLAKVGTLAHTLAAEYIGHEMPTWPPLAKSTIRDKAAKGFAVPAPLLRTGDMRDSISTELDAPELAVAVGSHEMKAVWQEMGTSRGIPPRSFLGLGMTNSMPYAADVFGEIAVELLTGKP